MIKITTSTSDILHQRFILMIKNYIYIRYTTPKIILMIKITTSTSDILHQRFILMIKSYIYIRYTTPKIYIND